MGPLVQDEVERDMLYINLHDSVCVCARICGSVIPWVVERVLLGVHVHVCGASLVY